MSRSMHYFRRYSGPILAVFGVILMITWVAGPFLESLFTTANRGGDNGNQVVVTWTGGSLRESDLQQMRYEHNTAVAFLAGIVNQTLQNGGTPQAPGLEIGPQGQILSPGIPVDDSDSSLVQTMLLAQRAREQGVAIDNDSVKDFLNRLSAFTMKEGDWFDIARRAIGNNGGYSIGQLFERLQIELLAQHMRMMELSGLTAVSAAGQIMPITPPPTEMYDYFLRLHRRATIEAVAFDTATYLKQVKDPTRADETELRALFEKGRDRDPNPALPEPGFYRPQKAAFEYFRVDFKPFLEEAKKQITEEQIKEEYEKAISQGQYKQLELPPESSDEPGKEEPKDDAKPEDPADQPKEDAAEKPADAPAEKPADDANAPAEEKPSEEKPAEDKPAAESTEEKPEEPKSEKAEEGSAQNVRAAGQQFRFVSTQAEEAAENSASEKPADAPPAENDAAPAEKPAEPATEKPASDAAPATEATDKPAEEKPADEASSSDKPSTEAPASEPPARFKPLEEVREDIINRLAQPIAEDARQAAMQKLVEAVRDYGRAYNRYLTAQETKSKTAKDPGKFNAAAAAQGIEGIQFETTPLINRYQAGEYPIGQNATIFNWQTGTSYGFGDVAFGPDERLYDPKYVNSREPDVLYIFWRTKAEKPSTPTYEEAREEVIAAWKRQKAFDLAKQAAEDLAKKAEKAESLKAIVNPATVIAPPPFTWLTLGSIPFGMSRPELSIVPGIEYAGQEFMQGVFALGEGQAGIAANQPHSRVYAVKMMKLEPKEDELRDRFAETGLFETMTITSAQWQDAVRQQRQQLDKEFDLTWLRPPQPGSQMR